MRLRTAVLIFLVLNAAWATLFFVTARQPVRIVVEGTNPVVLASAPGVSNKPAVKPATSNVSSLSTAAVARVVSTNAPAVTNPAPVAPVVVLTPIGRAFSWKDVQSDDYLKYIANLRAAGCPEVQVRRIIVQDINDLFDQKRAKDAVSKDFQWWQPQGLYAVAMFPQQLDPNLDEERRKLLEKLLGSNWGDTVRIPELNNGSTVAHLTGPVLGALPTETYNQVQEICSGSAERYQTYMMRRIGEGKPTEPVELARLRQHTRSELSKILTPEQLEEFLLRNSHNAQRLRQDLMGFNPTPEEFRKMFRVVDAIDHQLQMEYGGPEALSAKQREEYERQRDLAIKEALSPERYKAYMLTKDPVYRQAQVTAQQYGLFAVNAVDRLRNFYRDSNQRRQQVMQNAALNPQQKSAQIQALDIQQQQFLQQLIQEQAVQRQIIR